MKKEKILKSVYEWQLSTLRDEGRVLFVNEDSRGSWSVRIGAATVCGIPTDSLFYVVFAMSVMAERCNSQEVKEVGQLDPMKIEWMHYFIRDLIEKTGWTCAGGYLDAIENQYNKLTKEKETEK